MGAQRKVITDHNMSFFLRDKITMFILTAIILYVQFISYLLITFLLTSELQECKLFFMYVKRAALDKRCTNWTFWVGTCSTNYYRLTGRCSYPNKWRLCDIGPKRQNFCYATRGLLINAASFTHLFRLTFVTLRCWACRGIFTVSVMTS